jgi:hypothetical protein
MLRCPFPITITNGDLKKMVKNVDEEKIKRVLTEPKLAAIKSMLEKDHAIDCLLLLHVGRGKWKDAKDFMKENGLTLSDGTFRARMIEIESLGLAKSERIDPLKKYYVKTELGEKVSKLLLGFFDTLDSKS